MYMYGIIIIYNFIYMVEISPPNNSGCNCKLGLHLPV